MRLLLISGMVVIFSTLPSVTEASYMQTCLYKVKVLADTATQTLTTSDETKQIHEQNVLEVNVRFLAVSEAGRADGGCTLPKETQQVISFTSPPIASLKTGQIIRVLSCIKDNDADKTTTQELYLKIW